MTPVTLSPAPSTGHIPRPLSEHHQRLAELGDLARRRRRTTLVGLTLLGLILLVGGLAAMDYFWELRWGARAACLAMILAASGFALWVLWRRLRFDSGDAAAAAETAWPELGQRLRTSHDYALLPERAAPADPRLIESLELDTAARMRGRQVEPLAPAWPVWLAWAPVIALGLVWLALLMAEREWRTSTLRTALLPVEYTQVEVEPLPEMIAMRETLAIRANVAGRPLDKARVLYRPAGSDQAWSELPLRPEERGPLVGTLLAEISDVDRDLEVRIEAGPRDHPPQTVAVRIPLALKEMKARVVPPAYTRLPASAGPADSLQVPEGSAVTVTGIYNRPPQAVEGRVSPAAAAPPLQAKLDGVSANGTLPDLRASLEVALFARAADGMTSESPPLPIRVIPDEAPRVRFTSPEADSEAISTAEVQFSIEAADDYGLSHVGIRYKIADGEEQTLWEASPTDPPDQVRHTQTLALEDLALSFNQAITYYAFAEDNRQPKPQRVESELLFLDIRPFRRGYEFQNSNCSGQCQNECLTLEKLIGEQRDILRRTFAAERRQSASPPDKLSADEQGLQKKTESLAEALALKVGPIPPLDRAVEAMHAAIIALDGADLRAGRQAEEAALAQLIQARENLRNILKLSNSQSAACKAVDRQEQQKLRPPERERQDPEPQQPQLAQLREEMQQLAQQQRQWCTSASQCSSSASGSSSASQPSQSPSESQARSQSQSPSESPPQPDSPTGSESTTSRSDGQSKPGPQPEGSSSQPDGRPDGSPSREELVREQREHATAAERLQQALADGQFGQLAPERLEQAAESIAQSGEAFSRQQDQKALDRAAAAAEELERLAAHLGQRHSPDFSEKLNAAQTAAERMAAEQRQLAQSLGSESSQQGRQPTQSQGRGASEERSAVAGSQASGDNESAQQQRGLARRGQELADLIDQLSREAPEQSSEIERQLAGLSAAHPPGEAATAMAQAAEQLAAGKTPQASRAGHRAADDLEGLAAGLRQAQQALGQAELEQLIDAERQAAELLDRLESAGTPADEALARANARDFSESLTQLSQGDKQLAEAAEQLKNLAADGGRSSGDRGRAERPGPSSAERDAATGDRNAAEEVPHTSGVGTSARNAVEGLREVDKVLQRRIQEAILSGSLQQADETVPPAYKDMVESYYRTLSEDVE